MWMKMYSASTYLVGEAEHKQSVEKVTIRGLVVRPEEPDEVR
jgi:hypothetical protein